MKPSPQTNSPEHADEQPIKKVGIIGLGNFGRLLATLAPADVEVVGFSPRPKKDLVNIRQTTLAEVATADIIILCTPLSQLEKVVEELRPLITPETLIVDVCSVKLLPEQIIRSKLPGHQNVLLSHPLFGPQSAAKGTAGHTLIVTDSRGKRAKALIDFCAEQLGLNVIFMTSDEHDRAMAEIHALTFFVARGLGNLQLKNLPVVTPSFAMLKKLIEFDASESEDLFQTIERGNPHAEAMRRHFIESLQKIDRELIKAENDEVLGSIGNNGTSRVGEQKTS